MQIENNILKYYLQNVYFITGTAYAGKSTAAKMLAEKYGMILCGENYHAEVADRIADPAVQPDLCYMKQLESWADFVTRPPEEYERWIYGVSAEAAGFEVAALSVFCHLNGVRPFAQALPHLHRAAAGY